MSKGELMATALSVESVSKVHGRGDGAVRALDDVTLAIGDGDFVSIVGPSGSGKSSLLHLMAGLDAPTRGRVVVAAPGDRDARRRRALRVVTTRRRGR